MKKLVFILVAVCVAAVSCDPEENNRVSKEEIVSALKSDSELSVFAALVEEAVIEEDGPVTIFAVADRAFEHGEAADIFDYMVSSPYSEDMLLSGSELSAVGGGTLYVLRGGDDILVNGVRISGKPVMAGDSYIYKVYQLLYPFENTPPSSEQITQLQEHWNKSFLAYQKGAVDFDRRLSSIDRDFDFGTIRELSGDCWTLSRNAIGVAETQISIIEPWFEEGQRNPALEDIRAGAFWWQVRHFSLYGNIIATIDGSTVVLNGEEASDYLAMSLDRMIMLSDGDLKYAALFMKAKLMLLCGNYNAAADCCMQIIDSGRFFLTPSIENPGENEIIWKNFADASGRNISPLLLREVYLMNAVSFMKMGNMGHSLESVNMLRTAFGMPPVQDPSGIDASSLNAILRAMGADSGSIYPYHRILGLRPAGVGFGDKNYLLPVPERVFEKYPEIEQNPGY